MRLRITRINKNDYLLTRMNADKYSYQLVLHLFVSKCGKLRYCLFFTIFFLISCSDKKAIPKDILPKEKMQAVLWSLINAGEFLNGYVLKDSVDKVAESSKAYGQVFQIHHITKEEFDKSFSYYRQHYELMKAILDSLGKRQTFAIGEMQRRQDTMRKKVVQKAEAQ